MLPVVLENGQLWVYGCKSRSRKLNPSSVALSRVVADLSRTGGQSCAVEKQDELIFEKERTEIIEKENDYEYQTAMIIASQVLSTEERMQIDDHDFSLIEETPLIEINDTNELPDSIDTVSSDGNRLQDSESHQNGAFMIDDTHLKTMHAALIVCVGNNKSNRKKNDKWKNVTFEEFKDMMKSGASITNSFTRVELLECIRPMVTILRKNNIQCKLSWPKHQLVNMLSMLCGDGSMVEKKLRHKSSPPSLRNIIQKQLAKCSKETLAILHAESTFPEVYNAWQQKSPYCDETTIDGFPETYIVWFSQPEINWSLELVQFHVLDTEHIMTNLRSKICTAGLPGYSRLAWVKVAQANRENGTGLSLAMVDDMIDKQNEAFARATFSLKVENVMRTNGDHAEADLCKVFREWFEAEDDRGLSSHERCARRLRLRKWLLDDVKFDSFPPLTRYIKGIPIVTYEGMSFEIMQQYTI